MTHSMTGFAAREGRFEGWTWSWDLRSVNGRGLDLRLRLPDWIDGLEAPVRKALQAVVARGNVTLSLRVAQDMADSTGLLDASAVTRALSQMSQIEAAAAEAGVTLRESSAADVLSLRGIQDTASQDQPTAGLKDALLADLEPLLAAFVEMRAAEGAALHAVIGGQIDAIADGTAQARATLTDRTAHVKAANAAALARVMDAVDRADPDRIAQELALLAVKADVTEEIDRLGAHIGAARDLIGQGSPIGRKLDFLMQEFNREANTLCSKAQNAELTRVGLALKALIDQMREQVQNVE